MSTIIKGYRWIQVNGPISIAPVTPEQMKGKVLWLYILMGPTGSGKSSKRSFLQFIESLAADQQLNISKDSLESVTQEVNCYQVVNLGYQYSDRLFVLMDTPGFLDPRLSEGRITRMITDTLTTFRQYSRWIFVDIFYFQPITDIRIGGSKRDAVKILQGYIKQFNAQNITVITTMWDRLSTPKQLEDANCRLRTIKNEIYARSDNLKIEVTEFDTSQACALLSLDDSRYGWEDQNVNSVKAIDPHYQSLLCNNLLGRITTILQQLQLLAEDKQSATHSGSEDHCLLEVVLRDEAAALKSLASFLDDLASDIIGPSGMMALQSLLDARYEEDPSACLSLWQPEVSCVVLAWHQLHSPHVPTPSTTKHRTSSPATSFFAPITATFKKRFNRTWK